MGLSLNNYDVVLSVMFLAQEDKGDYVLAVKDVEVSNGLGWDLR